ncbi:hypothetical protein KR009_000303, partial [Drosophila setifemur]
TISAVAKKIRLQLGVEFGYYTIPKSRDGLLKFQPKLEELPERSMKDSYTTAQLLLKSDPSIAQRFVYEQGLVRLGRMMEELDILAVWICHRHVLLPNLPEGVPLPYTFITLMVDEVKFLGDQISADKDIVLLGHVSWTGSSSLEITMYAQQEGRTIIRAIFVIVARNAINNGPAPINPLKPGNEIEQCFYQEALERHNKRTAKRAHSKSTLKPSKEEEQIMYEIFTRTKETQGFAETFLPPNCRWMSKWNRKCTVHPFPENRNNVNTIFGGFTIRRAMETSYIAASLYCGSSASVKYLSEATFLKAIPVHSFLTATAYVVYTQDNFLQTMVAVNALDAESYKEVHSNALHLTYICEQELPEILPRSFEEALWYLKGRRKLHGFLKSQSSE